MVELTKSMILVYSMMREEIAPRFQTLTFTDAETGGMENSFVPANYDPRRNILLSSLWQMPVLLVRELWRHSSRDMVVSFGR